jgi:hypothetical protein
MLVVALVLIAVLAGYRVLHRRVDPTTPDARSVARTTSGEAHPPPETHDGFLYGRVTDAGGTTYEGRLRWGGAEEAFWTDAFNGVKSENVWSAHVPRERLEERRPIEILGFRFGTRTHRVDLVRPFVARFGDLARIDARGRALRVTLRSGTAVDLDRFQADDLADGLRVWDRRHGVVDLSERQIRSVEFLPTPDITDAPYRLQGTVHTAHAAYTGFVQWDRAACVGTDVLEGRTESGPVRIRFEAIDAIERGASDGTVVTLLDGRRIVLVAGDGREDGTAPRGIVVDDRDLGRVLVSWDAFERLDLAPGGSGPAYGDFPPGRPLEGNVLTRDGRRRAGRLVFDLDESETTDTLDAPAPGVDHTVWFDRIASIVVPDDADRSVRVTLRGGVVLDLERGGDLGPGNAGMLVFADGSDRAEYVPWAEVERVEFHPPPRGSVAP